MRRRSRAPKTTLAHKESIARRNDLIALRERGWSNQQLADYFGVAKKALRAIGAGRPRQRWGPGGTTRASSESQLARRRRGSLDLPVDLCSILWPSLDEQEEHAEQTESAADHGAISWIPAVAGRDQCAQNGAHKDPADQVFHRSQR